MTVNTTYKVQILAQPGDKLKQQTFKPNQEKNNNLTHNTFDEDHDNIY